MILILSFFFGALSVLGVEVAAALQLATRAVDDLLVARADLPILFTRLGATVDAWLGGFQLPL